MPLLTFSRWIVSCLVILSLASVVLADAPPLKTKLPDEKPYQQELRRFLGTLVAKDFEPAVTVKPTAAPITDPDELYRTWMLTTEFPRVGVIMHGARNAPGVNLPADHFTLANIEDAKLGIVQPAIWPETTAWLASWNYAGNPYYQSRALKLRAFVTASVVMMMMDDLQEHSKLLMHNRADWIGPHLVMYGYVYALTKDAVSPEARAAYQACVKSMMNRVTRFGPRGDESYLDICTVVGMKLCADAVGDPESAKAAEAYARRFFNDPWFYNPAGYFPEQGCFDAGFNGLSLYWGTWLALAAPDWTFAQDAVKKAWRLRAYLVLPEPDNQFTGLSHTNSRTGSDVYADQWDFPFRAMAATFLTDDAFCQARSHTDEKLKAAPETIAGMLEPQVRDYPGNDYMQRQKSAPWRWTMYPNSPQFPMSNYAWEFYPKGYFAKRDALVRANSPLMKFPFQRADPFTEIFGKVFLVTKKAKFGAIVHTGPVSEFKGEGHVPFTGPYGLSGGSLSAFWTPSAGSLILGRRAGMQFPNNKIPNYDTVDIWRTWPVHAVSGVTAGGKFFTSARIQEPAASIEKSGDRSIAKAAGVIPSAPIGDEKSLDGKLDYARQFTVDEKGVSIETSIAGDGKDSIAELYEVIPVYLRNAMTQPNAVPTTIEFEIGGKWAPATEQFSAGVQAVRLTRFGGAAIVRFDRARRVKLSPTDWNDTFMTRASCRNVLIDLLDNDDKPANVKEAKKIGYRIEPADK